MKIFGFLKNCFKHFILRKYSFLVKMEDKINPKQKERDKTGKQHRKIIRKKINKPKNVSIN